MIRKTLYKALQNRLHERLGDEIKHIDLWNHNIEFIEQEEGWERPAVFIEFGEISWERLGGAPLSMSGEGTLRVHLVTEWMGCTDEDILFLPFSLSDRIHRALFDLKGEGIHSFELLATYTNHNHEDLIENVDVYQFMVEKQL